jgi:hypothetical protein
MYKLIFALALAGCCFADPIPLTGSGGNYFDPQGNVTGGFLSFYGTNGIDTIQVQVDSPCTFLTSQFFGGCARVMATFDGVGYSSTLVLNPDTIRYTLGDGTVSLTSYASGITTVVPIRGYFNEGPFIHDYGGGPYAGHTDIAISSVPEPNSGIMPIIVLGTFVFLRLSSRRRWANV